MNYEATDINNAVALAMGEPLGADYLTDGSNGQQRFIAWAKPRLSGASKEVYESLKSFCPESIALCSALQIMDRVDWINLPTNEEHSGARPEFDMLEVMAAKVRAGDPIHVSGPLEGEVGLLHIAMVNRLKHLTGMPVHVIHS